MPPLRLWHWTSEIPSLRKAEEEDMEVVMEDHVQEKLTHSNQRREDSLREPLLPQPLISKVFK
jgi:hypothetical protein